LEAEVLHDYYDDIKDLALASDNNYPALNSDPFNLAVLYSSLL